MVLLLFEAGADLFEEDKVSDHFAFSLSLSLDHLITLTVFFLLPPHSRVNPLLIWFARGRAKGELCFV
jgi:hypothetical protein